MLSAGLGVIGLIIVVFSTVTTTFLDAYSAGVSSESISKKLKEKPVAIAVCVVGTGLAIFTSTAQFENFLYFIGSVFAPMTAILIVQLFYSEERPFGRRL
jgi:purine-cytosine permease-like protein